jgi:hypothetical protein
MRFEITAARDRLAGYPSFRNVFAYPYGDSPAVNNRVKQVIRDAGFEAAFTTTPRTVRGGAPRLALGRVCVDDLTAGEFRWLIDRYLCR